MGQQNCSYFGVGEWEAEQSRDLAQTVFTRIPNPYVRTCVGTWQAPINSRSLSHGTSVSVGLEPTASGRVENKGEVISLQFGRRRYGSPLGSDCTLAQHSS